jgi:hypothetical protein
MLAVWRGYAIATDVSWAVGLPAIMQEHASAAVRTVVERLGWHAIEHEQTSWDVLWMDCSVPIDCIMRLHPSQVA